MILTAIGQHFVSELMLNKSARRETTRLSPFVTELKQNSRNLKDELAPHELRLCRTSLWKKFESRRRKNISAGDDEDEDEDVSPRWGAGSSQELCERRSWIP